MAKVTQQPSVTRLTAEEVFDSVGPAYESAFANLKPQLDSIKWVLDLLASTGISRAKIVDVGCGTGKPVCAAFVDAGHDVLGIDVSSAMLDDARKKVPNAKFEKVDVREFQPGPSSLDVVTVYFSMIASLTQDEIRATFARFHSWIRPGGLLVFATVPVAGNNLDIEWMGRPITVSGIEAEEAIECVKKAGFEVVHSETSMFTPKAVDAGICRAEDVWEEPHLFIYATKH